MEFLWEAFEIGIPFICCLTNVNTFVRKSAQKCLPTLWFTDVFALFTFGHIPGRLLKATMAKRVFIEHNSIDEVYDRISRLYTNLHNMKRSTFDMTS